MDGTLLFQKVFGLLTGCAIGDAFGIRVEMMHYLDIEEQYGRVDHFEPLPPRKPSKQPAIEQWQPFGVQPQNELGYHPLGRWSQSVGAYTDDTRYRLIVYQAFLRKQGPITGRDLAEEWFNYRLRVEGASGTFPTLSWSGPERAYARLLASLDNLTEMVSSQRFCLKGWDAPLGLMYPGRPEEAARIGYSIAVAVATALSRGATLDAVIALAGEIMGVIYGAGAFPSAWIDQVLQSHPSPDLPQMARDLSALISRQALDSQRAAGQTLTMTGLQA